jgi:hypothetical protein
MDTIFFLVLRRMRMPLLALIATYAVAVIGMVLMPGMDGQGQPWHMDFLHALYFISYTATTIGFGELPYPFTPAQRLWATYSMYLTVIAWVYGLGTVLALLQDTALRLAFTRLRFVRTVRRLSEPFYLICGYGDTGSVLTRGLVERSLRAVVVDIDPAKIDSLQLANHPIYVPGLTADAALPATLLDAGLKHPLCGGVVALTNVDAVNLTIANHQAAQSRAGGDLSGGVSRYRGQHALLRHRYHHRSLRYLCRASRDGAAFSLPAPARGPADRLHG